MFTAWVERFLSLRKMNMPFLIFRFWIKIRIELQAYESNRSAIHYPHFKLHSKSCLAASFYGRNRRPTSRMLVFSICPWFLCHRAHCLTFCSSSYTHSEPESLSSPEAHPSGTVIFSRLQLAVSGTRVLLSLQKCPGNSPFVWETLLWDVSAAQVLCGRCLKKNISQENNRMQTKPDASN